MSRPLLALHLIGFSILCATIGRRMTEEGPEASTGTLTWVVLAISYGAFIAYTGGQETK